MLHYTIKAGRRLMRTRRSEGMTPDQVLAQWNEEDAARDSRRAEIVKGKPQTQIDDLVRQWIEEDTARRSRRRHAIWPRKL